MVLFYSTLLNRQDRGCNCVLHELPYSTYFLNSNRTRISNLKQKLTFRSFFQLSSKSSIFLQPLFQFHPFPTFLHFIGLTHFRLNYPSMVIGSRLRNASPELVLGNVTCPRSRRQCFYRQTKVIKNPPSDEIKRFENMFLKPFFAHFLPILAIFTTGHRRDRFFLLQIIRPSFHIVT